MKRNRIKVSTEVPEVVLNRGRHKVADFMRARLIAERRRFAVLVEDCRITNDKSAKLTATIPGSVHLSLFDDNEFRLNNPIGMRQGKDGFLEYLVFPGGGPELVLIRFR